jgi:hypothetical protein
LCSRLRKYIDISYQLVPGIVRKDKHRVTQSIAATWSSKQASITQARTDVVGSDVGAANLARADAGEESGDLVQRWQSTVNIANEMGMYTKRFGC